MSDVSWKKLCRFGFTFGSKFSFLGLKLFIKQTNRKIRPCLLARHAILLWLATTKQANEERNFEGCVAAG